MIKGGVISMPTIEFKIDEKAIQKQIEKKLDESLVSHLWFVDVEKIAQLTCMSKRYLEEEILCDPRMRVLERKRNRKRWWPAKQAFEVIQEITNEW